jgi:Zn-dependent M16 (insulinase) family peptidase
MDSYNAAKQQIDATQIKATLNHVRLQLMDINDEYEIGLMTKIMEADFSGQNPANVLDFNTYLKEIE